MSPLLRIATALVVLQVGLGPSPASAQGVPDRERVTLAFLDTDVRDALRLIGKQCDVNVVVSQGVSGSITLELEEATLEDTLDALAAVGGFSYTRTGRMVTVSTLDELLDQRRRIEEYEGPAAPPPPVDAETLVLNLRYVDAERLEPIVRSLLSETGKVSILKTTDHLARDRGSAATDTGDGAALQIGTRLQVSSESEPAKSHTLVVFDVPARLERVRKVVERLDLKPAQVVIEARFVEISLGEDQRHGIDWNVVARMSGAAAPHTGPFGSSSLGTIDPRSDGAGSGRLFPPAPDSVSLPGEPGLFTFGTLDFTGFTALLEMIERETRVQMVSNPHVVVRDRHTATILVGERYPILSANVSEFGTVTEQLDRYEPVGVQLAVTPSVLDDEVELLVRPSTSSLGADVKGSTGLAVARINSRQIDTLVTVGDGQTVVVGGLITTRDVESTSRVPFLGAIPLLGRLFEHESTSQERVDLVVFLTVSIVKESGLTDRQRRLFESTSLDADAEPVAAERRTSLAFRPPPPQY